MQLNLTGHHCDITPALRTFTTEKFDRLTKCGDSITHVNVVLKVEKLLHSADAILHVPGAEIHASANAKDMYAAIDELIDKLERQVKKHREKQKQHHHKPNATEE